MDSPSSSSMINFYYNEYFADGDGSTDEELEQEAVTSACQLVVRYVKHSSRPQAQKNKRGYVERVRRAAHDRLMKDYFDEAPTFSNEFFRRRFRMSKRLFLRIVNDLEANYDYFKQKPDARGALGFTGIIDVYGARYLRTPTWEDLQKIYEVHNAEHGLPDPGFLINVGQAELG
ncbi:uncharacterized protein LOC110944152 [Helianthus annuus]|uniref:uncharacterized protein LOC110944152 n=1 Tax=Helianthus annuus TaxID=4232 RepID=UPI001652D87C|nr:uncharacterized protein LOC110944152 [Helianthus annuus]